MPNPIKSFWPIQKFKMRFQRQKVFKRFLNFMQYRQKLIHTWSVFLNQEWLGHNILFSSANLKNELEIELFKILLLIGNNDTGQ